MLPDSIPRGAIHVPKNLSHDDADNGDDYDDFNNDDFDFDADDDDADNVQLVIRGELLEGKDSGLPIIKLQSASKRATNTFS